MKATKQLFYIFTLILTINFINNTILIPILAPLFLMPEYNFFSSETTFEIKAFLLGLTLACYPTAIFFGSPIFGKLCDCIGRKKTLLIVTVFTAFGNLITVIGIYFNNIYIIILGRLVAGITGGSSTPIKAIIADISDESNRNKNFSCISLAIGISNICGPFLGAELSNKELVSWFDTTTPLLFLFLIGVINLPLISYFIKETIHEITPFKLDFLTSFKKMNEVISLKELRLIMMMIFYYNVGYYIFANSFQTYLVKVFEINSKQLGMIFSYMGFIFLVAQLFIYNPIAKYLNQEKAISYSLLIYAFSMVLILSLNQFSYIYLALILTVVARVFLQTLLVTCVSGKASNDNQGKLHGYHSSVQALGELTGPLLGGILAGSFIWAPLISSALFMIMAYFVLKKIKN